HRVSGFGLDAPGRAELGVEKHGAGELQNAQRVREGVHGGPIIDNSGVSRKNRGRAIKCRRGGARILRLRSLMWVMANGPGTASRGLRYQEVTSCRPPAC